MDQLTDDRIVNYLQILIQSVVNIIVNKIGI